MAAAKKKEEKKEKAGYSSSYVRNNRVRKQLTQVDYTWADSLMCNYQSVYSWALYNLV